MIIDKKGRLWVFGWRINIIDFLVVVFILSLTPMVWFGYKLTSSRLSPPPPEVNWMDKYNNKISQEVRFLREYPRFKKYFE